MQESKEILDDLVRYDCLVGEPSRMLAVDSIDLLSKDYFSDWYDWTLSLICFTMQVPFATLFVYKERNKIKENIELLVNK